MVAEQVDLVPVVAGQPPEVFQARPPPAVVVGPLRGQRRDRVVVGRQLDPQVVGVADVQHPAVALPDRHPAVAERVAEERDEQDLGLEPEVHGPGLQPEPPPGRLRVGLPPRPVGELERHVAAVALRDAGVFLLGQVHPGVREVGQPARVVGVAVGEDDVRHVPGAEAERLDLPDGGVVLVELEPGHVDELLAQPLDGLPHVQQADAGVDEGEAVPVFEEQAVAEDLRVRRGVQGAAVDVVDGRHRGLSFPTAIKNGRRDPPFSPREKVAGTAGSAQIVHEGHSTPGGRLTSKQRPLIRPFGAPSPGGRRGSIRLHDGKPR